MVGAARFELATLCSQSRCATRLRYTPTSCVCGVQSSASQRQARSQNSTLPKAVAHCLLQTESTKAVQGLMLGDETICPGAKLSRPAVPAFTSRT